MAAGVGMVDVGFDYRFVVHKEEKALVAVYSPLLYKKWLVDSPSLFFCYVYYFGRNRVLYRGMGHDLHYSLHNKRMYSPLTIAFASKSALYPAPLALVLQQRTDLNELLQVLQKQFVDESKVAG